MAKACSPTKAAIHGCSACDDSFSHWALIGIGCASAVSWAGMTSLLSEVREVVGIDGVRPQGPNVGARRRPGSWIRTVLEGLDKSPDRLRPAGPMDRSALDAAHAAALNYLERLPGRRVGATATAAEMRAALGGPLPEEGEPAARVVAQLARAADPGLVTTAGPRFFGFVIGGSLP